MSAYRLIAGWILALMTLVAAEGSPFKTVFTRYMEQEDFQYLSEFFTGQEVADNRVLVRTTPDERTGLYVVVEMDRRLRDLPEDSRLELEMIRSDSNEVHRYQFPLPAEPRRAKVIYTGLTGETWPSDSLQPMAWRLRLVSASGEVLAEHRSFLWDLP